MKKHLEKVTTGDGSITLYSAEYDEHYHSLTGAYEEAIGKFVIPSDLYEKSKLKPLTILDICFGLGYNSFSALESGSNFFSQKIIAIEMDLSLSESVSKISYPHELWNSRIKELYKNRQIAYEKGSIELMIGDARTIVPTIEDTIDIVFLDPFSTSKNAELWTMDFFRLIKSKLSWDGVIVTYSSALPVLSGFLRAGFQLYQSDPVGRRRSGTIASLVPLSDKKPLKDRDQFLLKHSDGLVPYRDRRLCLESQEIILRRKKTINFLRKRGVIRKVSKCYKEYHSMEGQKPHQ